MRRGAALPMVLLSIGLVAALSVGGSFATRRFVSDGRHAQTASELEPALELGLVTALGALDSAFLNALAVGETKQSGAPVMNGEGGTVTTGWVTRLSERTFALVYEASNGRKPLQLNRLMLVATFDAGALRPIPLGAWTRLP